MRRLALLSIPLLVGCGSTGQYLASTFSRAHDALAHGAPEEALKYAKRGLGVSTYLDDSRWSWTFRTVEAEAYIQQRNLAAAVAVLRHDLPRDLASGELAVRVLMDRGAAFTLIAASSPSMDFSPAEASLRAASALCESSGNCLLRGELAMYQGLLEYRRGNQVAARQSLSDAIAFARLHHQPFVEAAAMSRLGAILGTTAQYARAADWLVPAVALTRQLKISSLLEANLGNLGVCLHKLGDLDSALRNFQDADRVAASLKLPAERSKWLTDIGLIFADRDDYETASTYHIRALEFARQGRQSGDISRSLHNLSLSSYHLKDYAASKRYHAEEVQLNGRGADDLYSAYMEGLIEEREGHHDRAEAQFQRIIAAGDKEPSLQWQAHVDLAEIHKAENKPELVERDFEEAIRSLETARRNLDKDESRLGFRSAANRYYNDYIGYLMGKGKPEAALRVTEVSRAQVLADSLGLANAPAAGLNRLQSTASAMHATILSYWLAQDNSYLFVITPDRFEAFTLPGAAAISSLVDSQRRTIVSSSKITDTRLYETLVAPARQLLPRNGRVIVIPDGSLHGLNFESLLVPGNPTPGERAPHFWIEDAVVSTATSLTLLRAKPPATGSRNVLVIGNAKQVSPDYAPLLHADAEIQSVAKGFPPARRAVFDGALAKPAEYRAANPSRYSWIHFAAHGVSNAESPLDSAIILSNDGESYKLYARDIAKIPINADLVTISACYGSGAKTYAGEGLVGLAWAFLSAGAHNVVASLWEANDYYTAQMMATMYRRLEAGDDPACALRTAKLELLHSEYICRNPRYWASFQLYNGY
jgi:CHAT domain-containing protein